MSEQVMVFPTKMMDGYKFQGVITKRAMQDVVLDILWNNKDLSYIDRAIAEVSPEYKQLIPYCVIKDTDGNIFSYERSKKGTELRLHSYRSVGVGGHVNPVDGEVSLDRAYRVALQREIFEEVGLSPEDYDDVVIAAVNDDSTEVGKVHFGLAHLVKLNPKSKEKMKLEGALAKGEWTCRSDLIRDVEQFENWSKYLIQSGVL